MPRPLLLAWALALGACFTGGFLAGQPCTSDADCGPTLRCEAGACGGPSGQTSGASLTDAPTSSATSTTSTATTDPTTTLGSSSGDATTGGGCGLGRCKDLDILFIIDNSPSMQTKGQILLSAVLAFDNTLAPLLESACSLHFGVLTTDRAAQNPPECQELGALIQNDTSGSPCTFIEGKPYATLPDFANPSSLGCTLGVGSDGSTDERPIDALLSVFDTNLNDGCNAGFYRPDAFLAVVIVTDEDDDDLDLQGHNGSERYSDNLWYEVLSTFRSNIADTYILGLLGDPDPNMTSCPWMPTTGDDGFGAESAPKLRAFIEQFPPERHAIGSICRAPDPNVYEPLMQEILAEVGAACDAA